MEKQELINAIAAVLCRQKHFALIKSNHATEEMAIDIVKELERLTEHGSFIAGDNDEMKVLPLRWL